MARVIVPVEALQYDIGRAFPLEAVDALHPLGFLEDDCYTYTMRVTVLHEEHRSEIRDALIRRLGQAEARRLIAFLDSNNWDVSFFVDSYEG